MNTKDVILLDVFEITGIEQQIVSNIEKMNNVAKQNNIKVFILNVFPPAEKILIIMDL